MLGSKTSKFSNALLTLVTAGLGLFLVVVVLQRFGVIGGAPVATRVAAAVGGVTTGGMPVSKPGKNNGKAYLDQDDPTLTGTEIGPNNWKIIDIHEHAQTEAEAERLLVAMDKYGVQRTCLMSATIYTFTLNNKYGFEQYQENNEAILKIKQRWPDRFCAFVTFDPSEPGSLELVKDAVKRGADGVKLYLGHGAATGKGPFHVMPIDDPRMEPFWAWAEQVQLPVLMHVNLIKFWDETISVLEHHPYLRLCLPHFGLHKNTEARLNKLAWIFDRYPNTFTDGSYGYYTFEIEGFEQFAKWRTRSRAYLQKYADRIMFASDMVLESTKNEDYIDATLRSYRQFHEAKAFRLYLVPSATMHGMDLDNETLKGIYERSASRFLLLDGNGNLPDRKANPVVEAPRPPLPALNKDSIPHDPQYLPRAEGEAYASSSTLAQLAGKKQTPGKDANTTGGGGEGPEVQAGEHENREHWDHLDDGDREAHTECR
jgi:predicted TIM-barrel fold metal-dependent hydrolase